jgi:phage-related protein
MATVIAGPAAAGSNTASTSTQRTVMINFKGQVSNLVASTRNATSEISRLGSSVSSVGTAVTSVMHGNVKPLMNGVFSAVGSLGSLFLVMPGFLTALVNPMNVVSMAMTNFGSAVSAASPAAFVAATRNMAPAMKQAVMAVRLLEPQLKNLYGVVEQGFWAPFESDINSLATIYFPVLDKGLGAIATTMGNLTNDLLQFLMQPQVVATIQQWMVAFSGLGKPLLNLVETMMPALISLFSDFATILEAILPIITAVMSVLGHVVSYITPFVAGASNLLSGVLGGLTNAATGALTGGNTSSSSGGGGSTSSSGGGSSSGGIGGFLSSIISGVGGFFSHLFGGGKALGGPVTAGRAYLVGEHGPEILSMGANGFIHPHNSLPQGHTFVTVKIGDTELRGMIRTEINNSNQEIALAARMGRGFMA